MSKFRLLYIPISILILCVIAVISYNFTRPESVKKESDHFSQFKIAPDFELPDAQNKMHKLDEWSGNLVILHFWATWCPPCLEEIPQWVELDTYFKGKKIKMVAVSLDQSWEDAHKVLPSQKLPPNIISLLDSKNQVPEAYGSFQYPETYLIGPDRKILMKWVGPQDWGSEPIRKFIEASLAKI
jgi:peroxiredoxin